MQQLEKNFPLQRYDVAAHSLGCNFVFSELDHADHWGQVYIFNPGSSPFQNTDVLAEYANIPSASYFLNSGCPIADGIRQQMDEVTLENNTYWGPWKWAPWSAHQLRQWIPSEFGQSDDLPPPPPSYEGTTDLVEDASMQQDTEETREAGLS